MKMTKKAAALFMSLAIAAACLSGCGSTNTPAAPETVLQKDAVKLNYWILGPGKQKDSDEVWAEFNKEIQQYLPNVTVDFTVIPASEYLEKWSKSMAAQETIDLAWTGWMINIPDEVNKGALMPLNELLDSYGKDIVENLSQTVIDIHKLGDGNLYQIPVWQGLVGGRNAIRFPAEVAELAGPTYMEELQQVFYENWAIPTAEAKSKVYDKVEEYLAAAAKGGKLAKGYDHCLNGWFAYEGTIQLNGTDSKMYVERGDNTFTVKSKDDSELNRMDCQYVADWYKKGYIRSDIASVETVSVTWETDKTWENSYITKIHNAFTDDTAETDSKKAGFEIVVAYTKPDCEYTLGTATGTSIPKTSKNPELAIQLVNLLVSDNGVKAYQTYAYGIEGKHWVDNGDGTAKTLCGDGQATSDWAYGGYKWTMGTCMNSLITQTDSPDYYKQLKDKEETAWVNPMLSFQFDNSNVQTETAQLKAVREEFGGMMGRGYLGDAWEAKFEENMSKLYQAGLQEYIDEVQRQVNEYVAANNITW